MEDFRFVSEQTVAIVQFQSEILPAVCISLKAIVRARRVKNIPVQFFHTFMKFDSIQYFMASVGIPIHAKNCSIARFRFFGGQTWHISNSAAIFVGVVVCGAVAEITATIV